MTAVALPVAGAVVAILAAVIGITATLLRTLRAWFRWRADGTTEVRKLACQMRTVFEDATAFGGVPSTTFMSDENRKLEADLTDLRGRLRDRKLRKGVDDLLGHWVQTFAAASPPLVSTPNPLATVSAEELRIRQRHLDAARAGLDDVRRVLDRCNHLTRWVNGAS